MNLNSGMFHTFRKAYFRQRRPPIHISVSSIWQEELATNGRCDAAAARLRHVWSLQFDISYVSNNWVIASFVLKHCSKSLTAKSSNSLQNIITKTNKYQPLLIAPAMSDNRSYLTSYYETLVSKEKGCTIKANSKATFLPWRVWVLWYRHQFLYSNLQYLSVKRSDIWNMYT